MSARISRDRSVVGLILALFCLQACMPVQPGRAAGEGGAATADAPASLRPVKLINLPFMTFAPFYIAQDEGYFTEQGLEVEFINMTQQKEIIPALVSGQVDVASGLVTAGLFNTIAKGADLAIVADKGYIDPAGCPNYAAIIRKGLAEQAAGDPAALAGLKTTAPVGGWLDYFFDRLVNEAGLSATDFEHVDLPSPAQLEGLNQGAIDISVNNEPWITLFQEAGHPMLLKPVTAVLPNSQSAVLLYGPNFLHDDPAAGERFMTAYLKAVRQYNEGKTDRNVEILANALNLDPELLRRMCWPTLRNDGAVNVESELDFQQWAVDTGLVEQPVSTDKLWNPAFTEYAVGVLDGN